MLPEGKAKSATYVDFSPLMRRRKSGNFNMLPYLNSMGKCSFLGVLNETWFWGRRDCIPHPRGFQRGGPKPLRKCAIAVRVF